MTTQGTMASARPFSCCSPAKGARCCWSTGTSKNADITQAQIKEEGGDATVFVGYVTNIDSCQEMTEAAVKTYGKLNVLINNVGISGPGSVTDVAEDFWDTVIDVNLQSVMIISKFAIPEMIRDGGGSIVNLSSIVGFWTGGGRPSRAYATSKGGISRLSNSMAVHYGRDNIRVNCIAPGHVYSPMVARHSSEGMLNLRRRAAPLGFDGTPWGWPTSSCSWCPTRPAGYPASRSPWTPAYWPHGQWAQSDYRFTFAVHR